MWQVLGAMVINGLRNLVILRIFSFLVVGTSDNFPSCQTNKINLKYNGRRQLTGETVQSVCYLLFLCLSRFLASVHIGSKLFLIYTRDSLHTCKRYKATVII